MMDDGCGLTFPDAFVQKTENAGGVRRGQALNKFI